MIDELRSQLEAAESDIHTEAGQANLVRCHDALYDALGVELGFQRNPVSGYFEDNEGRLCQLGSLESLYDNR